MAIQKIPNTLIADNAITATKIANGTLTADDIAANSITAAKLSASTSPTFGGLTVNSSEVLFDNTGGDFTLKLNTNAVGDKNEIIMGDSGTPLAKFGVSGTANDIITGSDGQDFNIGTAGGGRAINFSTDNFASVEMKLDGGNLGIGTTNPSTSLHIKKSGANGSYGRSPVDSNLIIENTNTSVTESGYLILSGYMGNTTSQYQTAAIGGGKQEAAGNGFYGGYLNFWTTSGGGNGESNSGQYERMRIDQTGNVGIGTTSPDAKLSVVGTSLTNVSTTGIPAIRAQGGYGGGIGLLDNKEAGWYAQDNGDTLYQYVGRTVGSDTPASKVVMTYKSTGNVGIGETSPGSQLQITSNTAGVNSILTIKNAVNNRESRIQLIDESNQGGLVLNYDNGGNEAYIKNNVNGALKIYLGGTAAANALDDYEEGTFTATLENTGTSPAPTANGSYTKIGRQVTIHIYFASSAGISSAGNCRISGLPFSASAINSSYGMVYYAHGNVVSDNKGSGYITGTFIDIIAEGSTGYAQWNTGTRYGMWTGIYQTA